MVNDMALNIQCAVDPFLRAPRRPMRPYATLVTGPAVRPVICTAHLHVRRRTPARGAVDREVAHRGAMRFDSHVTKTHFFRSVRHAE
jgi:hypothetical protein